MIAGTYCSSVISTLVLALRETRYVLLLRRLSNAKNVVLEMLTDCVYNLASIPSYVG